MQHDGNENKLISSAGGGAGAAVSRLCTSCPCCKPGKTTAPLLSLRFATRAAMRGCTQRCCFTQGMLRGYSRTRDQRRVDARFFGSPKRSLILETSQLSPAHRSDTNLLRVANPRYSVCVFCKHGHSQKAAAICSFTRGPRMCKSVILQQRCKGATLQLTPHVAAKKAPLTQIAKLQLLVAS